MQDEKEKENEKESREGGFLKKRKRCFKAKRRRSFWDQRHDKNGKNAGFLEKKRLGMSIFPKTFFVTLMLFATMILLVHGLVYVLMNQTYAMEKNRQAKENLIELSKLISEKSEDEIRKICEEFVVRKNVNLNLQIDGKIQHIQGFTGADIVTDELLGSELVPLVETEQLGSILISNLEIKNMNGKNVVIQMLSNMESLKEAREATLKILPYSLSISIIVAFVFSYFYSQLIVRPIKKIAKATRKMQEMEEVLCETTRKDEIGELAEDINELYSNLRKTILKIEDEKKRISRLEREKVDLIRSASHELKTPLSSLHIILENMLLETSEYQDREKYLKQAILIVEKMSEMVQEVLDSNRMLEKKEGKKEREKIEISEIIRREVSEYRLLAKTRELDFKLELKKCNIATDAVAITRVISNLVSNAVKYAEKGSRIQIRCGGRKIVIWNQCEPIDAEIIPELFNPFYRMRKMDDRKEKKMENTFLLEKREVVLRGGKKENNNNIEGSGMGLYFVKNILMELNHKYEFRASGKGMQFTIVF